MRKNLWFWLLALLTAAALVASAILLVDYVRPAPVFCEASGCAKMKMTVFARPLGLPLPAIGIAGLLGIGLAALVPGRSSRIVQAGLAVVGGIVGAFLLLVQAAASTLCPFCVVVDGGVILLAALSLARLKKGWDPPAGRAIPSGVALGLVAAVAVPLAIGMARRTIPSDVPDAIAAEMRTTGRGKVTIVDFADFECPFCRMTHAELAPLIEKHRAKVRVVRKHVPLRMHPHAMDAAKAACCGEDQGKGEEMADALFSAPPSALTPEGCEKIAEGLGLDLERFKACVRDPATTARIDRDRETFRAVNAVGLPTLFIDDKRFDGAQDREALEAALDAALR